MPPSAIELELVARFRAAGGGKRSAIFQEIFQFHRDRVFELCCRLCGSTAVAEDAVQETFVEVYKGLPLFRGEASLATWIYRVAMRAALRLRARERRTQHATMYTAPVAANLEAGLAARDDVRAVYTALDALPAEQRVVVALFSIDGLSHGEIAAILGVPEGTVWSRLHKGRKALAAALK
jgi:RNA polymerase sigma-70 factor (ECF subfamily)